MINAIEENDINKLASILKVANPNSVQSIGVIDVLTEKQNKRTPLGAACEKGNLEMVELLIAEGADVNYVPLNAETSPLGFAVQSDSIQNLQVVKLLIENGVDVNYYHYKNWKPAYELLNNREFPPNGIEILKEMMNAGIDTQDRYFLSDACYWKHDEAIRLLVNEYGYDASDSYYLCAYCKGVEKYSYEMLEYFLQHDANPYKKDNYEKCAIDYLKEHSPEWAEKLINLATKYGFEK